VISLRERQVSRWRSTRTGRITARFIRRWSALLCPARRARPRRRPHRRQHPHPRHLRIERSLFTSQARRVRTRHALPAVTARLVSQSLNDFRGLKGEEKSSTCPATRSCRTPPAESAASPPPRALFGSLVWLMGNWWIHDNLHMPVGLEMNRLIFIELFFPYRRVLPEELRHDAPRLRAGARSGPAADRGGSGRWPQD
jgi:hypothetical protein